MTASTFDPRRAYFRGPGNFPRLEVPPEGLPLRDQDLPGEEEILVVRRGDTSRALRVVDLHFHHLAQGELAGEPWMVSF